LIVADIDPGQGSEWSNPNWQELFFIPKFEVSNYQWKFNWLPCKIWTKIAFSQKNHFQLSDKICNVLFTLWDLIKIFPWKPLAVNNYFKGSDENTCLQMYLTVMKWQIRHQITNYAFSFPVIIYAVLTQKCLYIMHLNFYSQHTNTAQPYCFWHFSHQTPLLEWNSSLPTLIRILLKF
jgi:hypothetical protein